MLSAAGLVSSIIKYCVTVFIAPVSRPLLEVELWLVTAYLVLDDTSLKISFTEKHFSFVPFLQYNQSF